MYELSVYPITPDLWRWEIRCGGALLRCGTASTRVAAERDVSEIVNLSVGQVFSLDDWTPPRGT